jgi:hypothetical protein
MTVGDILKGKLAKILRAPLPKGTPSLEGLRGTRWGDMVRPAKLGNRRYQTIKKLLTDGRFNKRYF